MHARRSCCPAVCSAPGALPDNCIRRRSADAQRGVQNWRAWAACRQGCLALMGADAGSARSTPRPKYETRITSLLCGMRVRAVPSRWNPRANLTATLPQDVRRRAARSGAGHRERWFRRDNLTVDSLWAHHAAAMASLHRRAGVRCSACAAAGGRTDPATNRRVGAALFMRMSAAAAFSVSAARRRRRVTVMPGGTFLLVRRRAYTARRACALVRNGCHDSLEALLCVRVAAPLF